MKNYKDKNIYEIVGVKDGKAITYKSGTISQIKEAYCLISKTWSMKQLKIL